MLKCCGHETITTGLVPGALDSAFYSGKYIVEVFVTVEDAPIRFTVHNVNPDDGEKVGHLMPAGSSFRVSGPDVDNLRFVQSGATSGTLNVSYYNNA